MMRIVVAAVAACAGPPAAAQDCFAVDAARGSVGYEVRQAGAPFRGVFRRFGGEVCIAGDRATRVDVWLEPGSSDSGLPEIDKALRDDEFFAVARHPRAAFAAQSVETRGAGLVARGTLDLKGRRGPIDVPFVLQRQGDGWTVSGSLTMDRLQFDVGTGEWSNTKWLGREVRIDFRAPLVRK
jgi:polyisoprenoid-binding protein YceI